MNKSIFLALAFCYFATPAQAQSNVSLVETPLPADSLVDSMGVNVHLTYANTAYSNSGAVKSMLSTLGIRHVRDGGKFYPNDSGYDNGEFAAFGEVSSLGIGFDLILDFSQGVDPNPVTSTVISEIQSLAKNHNVILDAYEGPNEIDRSGANWVAETRAFMQSLHSSVKNTPLASAIPVIGNSLSGPDSDWVLLGNMSAEEDFGNLHPYANTQFPSYNFPQNFANEVHVSGSQNIYITEAGWSNALHTKNNTPNVTEDVASRYISRLFLEALLRGAPRTYVYELVDEQADSSQTNMEMHFGLFRNDYSAKPAATTIGNTVALLSDRGPKGNLQPLSYTLAIPSSSVHHLLFQKRDGSYWLALWQEVSNWKGWNAQGSPITNPDVPVQITLTQPASSIQTFRPHDSINAVETFSNQQSVSVMVPDHTLYVKILLLDPPVNLKANVH